MATENAVETHAFQTEVQQLLHLMIHSLYTNKEIFLRELISNASDALDRLRFAALTDDSLMDNDDELRIRVSFDEKLKTVTVSDNGIGMSEDEVIENIGTIARSGTRQFVNALSGDEPADTQLIGQFGVGFYSVFLVAKKVVLTTRRAGSTANDAVRWSSEGTGEYSIQPETRTERGTTVVIYLNPDEKEYLDAFRLRNIVSTYSDHIALPIQMLEKTEGEEEKSEPQWTAVNSGSPLWTRAKKDVTDEQYNQFYTNLTYDNEAPLITLHNRVEGKLDYVALLFIPSKAPFDLWDRERRHGVSLYVRRIFIMDDAKHLMPTYLRFVRGVVDAADLPLNVSREFLQNNRDIDRIRSASVKKVLSELKRTANKEPDKYATLWKAFGRVLKEGLVEDPDNKTALAELLRFTTTHSDSDDESVSLSTYVKRMPSKQKAIYFITAESASSARSSPHLEIFHKNDIEVLLLGDPVDEWMVNGLGEYDGKPLKSVSRGELDLDELEKASDSNSNKEKTGAVDELLKKMEESLGERVKSVRVSHRLTDSPACLVADENDIGGNLERILSAMGQDAPETKPIMEINPQHPLIKQLSAEHAQLDDWSAVLFDQAALAEGAPLSEPSAYVRRVNDLLTRAALLGS
ncbi:MAG: molecular chaperone HtpG [Pseudomonadota bacterium]|nr:molecular chaperone HtpG [Pseudomonadota bacterium]